MGSVNNENDQTTATHMVNNDQNNEETKEYIKLLIKNLKAGDTNLW